MYTTILIKEHHAYKTMRHGAKCAGRMFSSFRTLPHAISSDVSALGHPAQRSLCVPKKEVPCIQKTRLFDQ